MTYDDDDLDMPFDREYRTPSDCFDGDLYTHTWTPISFVFETQLLDDEGRVLTRQPDTKNARVYCVCMKCHKHTYIVSPWAEFYLTSPIDQENR